MLRLPAVFLGIIVIVVSGLIHGLWSDRWGLSSEPATSASKLAGVPTTLGDWYMCDESSLDAREQANAGIAGYLIRRYVQNGKGNQVQMYLLCGRSGQISVHTPDICFAGAGYEFSNSPERKTGIGQPGDDFWVGQCAKRTAALPEQVRVYWSWSATGQWQAPDNPRLNFARSKALFKLYVIHAVPSLGEPIDKDPSLDFITQLLPELRRCLFSEQGNK
jgi:hypothetical protein